MKTLKQKIKKILKALFTQKEVCPRNQKTLTEMKNVQTLKYYQFGVYPG